ncbi:hypothetical protein AMECASPLE_032170, partial [Ameca splendens]
HLNLTLPSASNPTIFWKEAIQPHEPRLKSPVTSLDQTSWQSPDSFVPRIYLCEPCPPYSSHCTNYRNSRTINHPGTPVFTVSGPTGQQPPGLSTPSLADLSLKSLVSRFQSPTHFNILSINFLPL